MKNESIITLPVVYQSNEYSDVPTQVKITFTAEEVDAIAHIQVLIGDNKKYGIRCANISCSNYDYADSDGNPSDFPDSGDADIVVYRDAIMFRGFNKYDSGDNFETDCVEILDLFKGFNN